MPQGLPKKIEVGLLLPDLALELGDPASCRRPLIEERTPQRWPIQRSLARPAGPPQRFQSTLPNLLLPFVQPLAIEPKRGGDSRHLLSLGDALYRPAFDFC